MSYLIFPAFYEVDNFSPLKGIEVAFCFQARRKNMCIRSGYSI